MKSLDSDKPSSNEFSDLSELNDQEMSPEELKDVLASELSADLVQRYLQQIASKPLLPLSKS